MKISSSSRITVGTATLSMSRSDLKSRHFLVYFWIEDVQSATLALSQLLSDQYCVISSYRFIASAGMAITQAGGIFHAVLSCSFSEKSQQLTDATVCQHSHSAPSQTSSLRPTKNGMKVNTGHAHSRAVGSN